MTAEPDRAPAPDADLATARAPWPGPFVDALAADPRVIGAADLSGMSCEQGVCVPPTARVLLLVTTWDGFDRVVADLPRLAALALGAEPAIAARDGARWSGLTEDQRRLEIDVVRIGDLKPSARGEGASVVHDTKRLVDQWVRWSRNRDRSKETPTDDDRAARRLRRVLDIEESLRQFEGWRIGTVALRGDATSAPLRPGVAARLRERREELDAAVPVERALLARLDAALDACPQPGAGLRVLPGRDGPAAAYDAFLRVADGEGFLGDRVLFDAAAKRLAELAGRAPDFDEGFVLPSFDAVEVRFRFGEGVGGCKTPLVPCVHVGVGVTPADHLEFWAAPAVREAACTVACVADAGTRVVVPRTAGKDAFFAALFGEVDRAWDELPEFLRTARRAGRVPAGDADETLRPLHLPRSYRAAAKRLLAPQPSPSRLQAAIALARAGHDQEPVNARKLGLGAGRLIALTPPGAGEDADDACGPSCDEGPAGRS